MRTKPAMKRPENFVYKAAPVARSALSFFIMFPVPTPGFRGRFRAGLGSKPSANGPTTGSKLSETEAATILDRFVGSFTLDFGPKSCPESPAQDRLCYQATQNTPIVCLLQWCESQGCGLPENGQVRLRSQITRNQKESGRPQFPRNQIRL